MSNVKAIAINDEPTYRVYEILALLVFILPVKDEVALCFTNGTFFRKYLKTITS